MTEMIVADCEQHPDQESGFILDLFLIVTLVGTVLVSASS